jgi:hypothetical protein
MVRQPGIDVVNKTILFPPLTFLVRLFDLD